MTEEFFRMTLENRLLQVLSQAGEMPATNITITTGFAGRTVILQILHAIPAKRCRDVRTECERDCIRVLTEAGVPLTRVKIIQALESLQLIWGESTVSATLADLHKDGLLENSRKKGGYYLLETNQ